MRDDFAWIGAHRNLRVLLLRPKRPKKRYRRRQCTVPGDSLFDGDWSPLARRSPKPSLESVQDFIPRSRLVGITSPMGGQAFIEDLTLPLVQRSLIGAPGDPLQGRSDIAGHGQIVPGARDTLSREVSREPGGAGANRLATECRESCRAHGFGTSYLVSPVRPSRRWRGRIAHGLRSSGR